MHDANGTPLKVGDRVIIPAIIVNLSASEDYCNAVLQTSLVRRPDGMFEQIAAINTGVVLRANKEDEINFDRAF